MRCRLEWAAQMAEGRPPIACVRVCAGPFWIVCIYIYVYILRFAKNPCVINYIFIIKNAQIHVQREVLENAWFRKVPGRFPEGFPEEIANSRKRMVPEGFRKVPGRFLGRAKTHKAPPPPKASPEIPEDFRKVSGRFPEEQPPAATPRSTGVGN